MKIEKKFLILIICAVVAALFLVNFLIFKAFPDIFVTIIFIGTTALVFPLVLIRYISYRKRKEIEEMFPVFLRDLTEAIRGGLQVPQAFKSVARNNYKSLTPYVKKIARQLEWGLTVEKVLLNFSKSVKSPLIERVITSVIETHRSGGRLADVFEALCNAVVEVRRLRAERKTYLQSQLISGYITFFIFIVIMLALAKFIIPEMAQSPLAENIKIEPKIIAAEYKGIFRNLIIIQGFFAGLCVGKIAEGAMIAGLKHSIIMIGIGLIAFIFI